MLSGLALEYANWLRSAQKAPATVLAYQKDVEQFLTYLLRGGVNDPKQVDDERVRQYQKELETLRYTEKSISRKLNSLKSFFAYLVEVGQVAQNPLLTVAHPKYTLGEVRVLLPSEYEALREACRSDVRLSTVVEVLLQTGLRISELAALRVDDISLEKKELFVLANGSHPSRVVPLNNPALQALKQYLRVRPRSSERTFFLTKSCRPFLVRNIRSAVDRYFKLAGVKGAKLNDLRHTFIVAQLRSGVPLVTVSQVVGHKRLSTTERYLQYIGTHTNAEPIAIREL